MAGLPKSYIKKYGISARAWREYRKAKRKTKKRGGGKVAKRKTTRRKSTRRAAPRRKASRRRTYRSRARAVTRRARTTMRGVMSKSTQAAIKTGIGVAGAAGSAMLLNSLPMDARTKAWSQLALGVGLIALTPKRAMNMKLAGSGAALVGAMAVMRTAGLPIPPLMAGTNRMGLNYYPGMGRAYRNRRLLARPYAQAAASVERNTKQMGINIHKGGMAGGGYGNRFVTQANM